MSFYNTPKIKTKPGTGVEQSYPGQKFGMTLSQAKDYVQNQPKSLGYKIAMVVGPVTQKIQLPGDAAIFIGIGFNAPLVAGVPTPADAEFTLNVNQTIIHENIGVQFATVGNAGGLGIQPYFPVGLPVSGNDTIQLTFSSNFAGNLLTLIYYK